MLKNYLKVALRYLSRHKAHTVINVLGLSVSVACCILIMLFVRNEFSYNRFHGKADHIYRAWLKEHYQGEIFNNIATPIPLGTVVQSGVPEVQSTCRIGGGNALLEWGSSRLNGEYTIVDSNFFDVFDFKLVEGDRRRPFPSSRSAILTQAEAKRIFGKEPAIGKSIGVSLNDSLVLFTVAGITADPPKESSLQFTLLIPFSNGPLLWSEGARTGGWSTVVVQTYFLMKPGVDLSSVHRKIDAVMNPLVSKNYKPGEYQVRLQPLNDIYFNTLLPEDVGGDSDPKYSYILGTIGIMILLIACINFITLSVGRSVTRALEVGVRKVLGAERNQLVVQFWGEAILLTLLSVVIGVVLALVLLKPFNGLANRELSISFTPFTLLFLLALIVVIGLVAGIYPALVLSRFKPIMVLKGKLKVDRIGLFRRSLIVGQFMATIVMIIATVTVGRQLDYLRTKDLGFQKDHVIIVPTGLRTGEGRAFAKKFQAELQKEPEVLSSTASWFALHNYGWMNMGYTDDRKVFRQFRFNVIDEDFVPAMGLKVVKGRNFQKGNPGDSNYILVNEALVRAYGWKEPLGQKLPGKYSQTVVGVVKDFHVQTLYTPVEPVVMTLRGKDVAENSSDVSYDAPPNTRISVRFKAGDVQAHVALLRTAWKKIAGDREFDNVFLDETLAASYEQERRLSVIVRWACILSIFIACMGLFGLTTLVVVRRTKEIGIRKVLGADAGKLVMLISREFIWLVAIAALVAFPLAWWALRNWLQDFAYRISMPWWVFLLSAVAALAVALVTVSVQAVKAAMMNPVKSLRTE